MRKSFPVQSLTPLEVESFRMLTGGNTGASAIAATVGKSRQRISDVLGRLKKKGLVDVERSGQGNRIMVSKNAHAALLSELIAGYPMVPWESVITNSAATIFYEHLRNGMDFEIDQRTRRRIVRKLKGMGLHPGSASPLSKKIDAFFSSFGDFVSRDFAAHTVPPKCAVLWRRGFRILIRAPTGASVMPFVETGLTAIKEMDVPLIGDYDYYYYEPGIGRLAIEDVVVHTVLADPDDSSAVAFALLAVAKHPEIDWDATLEKGESFGIGERMRSVREFWESSGKVRGRRLPAWSEFLELARMYKVRVRR